MNKASSTSSPKWMSTCMKLAALYNILWGAWAVPFSFIYTLITNDFIWWIPFFLIMKRVHQIHKWKLGD